MAEPQKNSFSVDTHVFRELGELLVGRDSTALLELIKNCYDADATEVTVSALDLADTSRGRIVIRDNGCGMDEERFRNGFLRIASRFKESGDRRSDHFQRRYTGSKGIGRLAAHKLAKYMEV
ncbi:MAG: ATP-binding protein, partial [Planctomycetes bacterium]|nr:ATP-binding protein [Planctomycetota bacterium]